MPTVHREGPYRLFFYSHEPDEPPHVHVDRDNATAKVWLTPVTVASAQGFRPRELRRVLEIVRCSQGKLLEAWDGFFGTTEW